VSGSHRTHVPAAVQFVSTHAPSDSTVGAVHTRHASAAASNTAHCVGAQWPDRAVPRPALTLQTVHPVDWDLMLAAVSVLWSTYRGAVTRAPRAPTSDKHGPCARRRHHITQMARGTLHIPYAHALQCVVLHALHSDPCRHAHVAPIRPASHCTHAVPAPSQTLQCSTWHVTHVPMLLTVWPGQHCVQARVELHA
jgi:hypothetical protein